jgi:hypothetical protein
MGYSPFQTGRLSRDWLTLRGHDINWHKGSEGPSFLEPVNGTTSQKVGSPAVNDHPVFFDHTGEGCYATFSFVLWELCGQSRLKPAEIQLVSMFVGGRA